MRADATEVTLPASVLAADGAASQTPSSSSAPARDYRADCFRGASLLFILWNHVFFVAGVSAPLLLRFTPINWGLASSTEAFVFLSGYVYGIVYLGVAERFGRGGVWIKSVLRAWHLYVANAITMVISLGLASWWATSGRVISTPLRNRLYLDAFMTPDAGIFWNLAQLYRRPWGFGVLDLYVVLLLLGPIYILVVRRSVWQAALIGLVLYIMAQLGANLPSGHGKGDVWYFSPFAWQLLFLIGIIVGTQRIALPRSRLVVVASGTVVVALAAWLWLLPWLAPHLPRGSGTATRMLGVPVPWTGVTNLQPLRLAYFLVLALFIAGLTNKASTFWTSAAMRPLVIAGTFSLEVFCFGLVFTYAAGLVLTTAGASWPLTTLAATIGCGLSIAFAYLLRARRSATAWLAGRPAVSESARPQPAEPRRPQPPVPV